MSVAAGGRLRLRADRLRAPFLARLGADGRGRWLLAQALLAWPRWRAGRRALLRGQVAAGEWRPALAHARRLGPAAEEELEVRLELARLLNRAGRAGDAIAQLEPLRVALPGCGKVRHRLGLAYLRKRRFADAAHCFEAGYADLAKRARNLFLAGRARELKGDRTAAQRHYREARAELAARARDARAFRLWLLVEHRLGAEAGFAEVLDAAVRRCCDATPELLDAWLVELSGEVVLDADLLRVAETRAAADPGGDLAWIARAARLLGAGRGAEAAQLLGALDPAKRERRAWSRLMHAAGPAHFADAGRPPRAGPRARPDLAAVCCYFNPAGFRSRRRTYETFRRHLCASGVRLLTLELAFDDAPHELAVGDDVLRLRARDVLWHKERLLNLGIERLLAEGWPKLAWLDADVVFEDPAWWRAVSRVLDDVPVCQAFDRVYVRRAAGDPGRYGLGEVARAASGAARVAAENWCGFAWAARADLLREVTLYDAHILGGGDALIHAASELRAGSGRIGAFLERRLERLPAALREHYLRWAEAWSRRVDGRVGFVAQPLQSLFHGEIKRRGYESRYTMLQQNGFDPERDLALDPGSGCWRWASDKPALHRAVTSYFHTRCEDGLDEPALGYGSNGG